VSRRSDVIERRIFWLGVSFVSVGGILAWLLFGNHRAVSFLAGGALAGISLAWLRRSVGRLMLHGGAKSKGSILAGYLLRLLLIPLSLYAMFRLLYLSLPAAVLGFAVFHCGILVEGILEATAGGSSNDARAK